MSSRDNDQSDSSTSKSFLPRFKPVYNSESASVNMPTPNSGISNAVFKRFVVDPVNNVSSSMKVNKSSSLNEPKEGSSSKGLNAHNLTYYQEEFKLKNNNKNNEDADSNDKNKISSGSIQRTFVVEKQTFLSSSSSVNKTLTDRQSALIQKLSNEGIRYEKYFPSITQQEYGAHIFYVHGCVSFYRVSLKDRPGGISIYEPWFVVAAILRFMGGNPENTKNLDVELVFNSEIDPETNRNGEIVDKLNKEYKELIMLKFKEFVKTYYDLTMKHIIAFPRKMALKETLDEEELDDMATLTPEDLEKYQEDISLPTKSAMDQMYGDNSASKSDKTKNEGGEESEVESCYGGSNKSFDDNSSMGGGDVDPESLMDFDFEEEYEKSRAEEEAASSSSKGKKKAQPCNLCKSGRTINVYTLPCRCPMMCSLCYKEAIDKHTISWDYCSICNDSVTKYVTED